MGDVSNKTIVALLVVALVVTVIGTIISVSKLSDLGGQYTFLTGAATDTGTGTTQINIAGTVGIEMVDSGIDFSAGYYNASCTQDYGYLATDGEASQCWINYSNASQADTTFVLDDPHNIRNNGTTVVNVTIDFTSTDAEAFLCGTGDCDATDIAGVGVDSADWSGETGACSSGLVTAYTELADTDGKTQVLLCSYLNYETENDQIEVNFNLTIPKDVDQGQKTETVTYTAESI